MPVLGFDLGTSHTLVGAIVKGVPDVVRNDVSDRMSPTLISYTPKQRLFAEQAEAQLKTNLAVSCRNFKNVLACEYSSGFQKLEEGFSYVPFQATEDGFTGYLVNGEVKSTVSVLAAYMAHLSRMCLRQHIPSNDIVLAVPSWYQPVHKEAMMYAAKIAGLNCVDVMTEHAAAALYYGHTKRDLFKEPTMVCFVCVGHSTSFVSVAEFTSNCVRIVAAESDPTAGGRDMDMVIRDHMLTTFEKAHPSVNVRTNRKALLKLDENVIRVKKMLSTNPDASYTIECFVEDWDLNGTITKEEFEASCLPIKEKLSRLLKNVLAVSGDVVTVEGFGGSMRVPWVKETVAEFFVSDIGLMLNAGDGIARGCVLQGAYKNPAIRANQIIRVNDILQCGIHLKMDCNVFDVEGVQIEGNSARVDLFRAGSTFPAVVKIPFKSEKSFFEFTVYNSSGHLGERKMGSYKVTVPSDASGKRGMISFMLDTGGLLTVSNPYVSEEEKYVELRKEKRPKVPTEAPKEVPPPTEGEEAPAEPPVEYEEIEVPVEKTRQKRTELKMVITPGYGHISTETLKKHIGVEEAGLASDLKFQNAENAMNALESYILTQRSSVPKEMTVYLKYMSKEQIDAHLKDIEDAEQWLWDHMDEVEEVYTGKLNVLKELGDIPRRAMKAEADALKKAAEEKARKLREEKAKKAAEEKAKKDAEEKAKKDAEDAAKPAEDEKVATEQSEQPVVDE